eukprot:5484023-Pyramimonas_sp.AAC.1
MPPSYDETLVNGSDKDAFLLSGGPNIPGTAMPYVLAMPAPPSPMGPPRQFSELEPCRCKRCKPPPREKESQPKWVQEKGGWAQGVPQSASPQSRPAARLRIASECP